MRIHCSEEDLYEHTGTKRKSKKAGQHKKDDRFFSGRSQSGWSSPSRLKKIAMILSSGDPNMYDGAMFSYQGDFLDYLGLEDMGVYTAYGAENASTEKLRELKAFGRSLK